MYIYRNTYIYTHTYVCIYLLYILITNKHFHIYVVLKYIYIKIQLNLLFSLWMTKLSFKKTRKVDGKEREGEGSNGRDQDL